MTRKPQPSSDEIIIADWDTGEYSRDHGGSKTQRDLAYKHNVSVAKINKMVKGREPRMYKIVNNLVFAKQILSEQNEQTVNSVNAIVEERSRHIQFFNQAALKNVTSAVNKIGASTSQAEHRMIAETIAKGKEVVLGKDPDTAIQINNQGESSKVIDASKLSTEALREIAAARNAN